jgi:hypothetical protein
MAGRHIMRAEKGGAGVAPAQVALRSAADTDAMLDAYDLGDPPAGLSPTSPDGPAVPMLSEIIDGPVAPLDRVRAFDMLRGICRRAPRPVCSARARLTSVPEGGATPLAIAEVILVLDGGLIVAAGSEGTTMREAVDDLSARLRRRLANIARRTPPPSLADVG